ncbi:hypothetical protein BKA57DRAFT_516490 [Linnemannia elongata]|nr:hypothetical protein BKA57DRAFT_516490 [Linnemannia elongata]KAK5821202.1 hypothetical protein F5H01DRAFT_412326 [Linnemannia elongata]
MKIGNLLLGLAASVATALPARNQTSTPSISGRNSTRTSPNAISVQGCKSTTLRWWREPIGAGMWNSLFKFTVSGIYSGTIPPHQDPFRFSDYCSNDGIFCVRHIMGPASWAVNFTYGERVYIQPEISYNHTAPQIGNRNWDVEYWGCVLV